MKVGNILLHNSHDLHYGTTGFRFKASHQGRVVGVYSLGWEKQINTSYCWNGLNRSEENIFVFQYTLKGAGEIIIENQIHRLNKGKAFFIKIPSDHCYYLPKDSNGWEFIHLTLFGREASESHNEIINELGYVFNLDMHSSPITIVFDLLKDVSNQNINDAFEASARGFSFLMELQRFALDLMHNKERPHSIAKAINFMHRYYANPITLDDIVKSSTLSKYHFTRLFHKTVQLTPIQYLTKVRINQSIELLKDESLTIEEIALKVGFSNGNYFSKVFRSSLGLSPSEFRSSKTFSPIDSFVSD